MKLFNVARKYGAKVPAAVGALALSVAGSVHAEVPAAVTSEMTSMKADGITIATAVLVALIAIFAFKFMRKGL